MILFGTAAERLAQIEGAIDLGHFTTARELWDLVEPLLKDLRNEVSEAEGEVADLESQVDELEEKVEEFEENATKGAK